MINFIHIKFEVFLLFFICYIALLYICVKFFGFKLDNLDFIFVSFFFLYLLFQCSFDDLDLDFNIYFLNNFFIYNSFIQLLKLFMVLFFVIYLVLVYNFNDIIKIPLVEYLILIFLSFFSLVIMIVSNHLFIIFLFLEVLNICLYCLIGLNKNSNKGIEAAFKYFVQSAVATLVGFFAISLIYLLTGTLFLNELAALWLLGSDLPLLAQFSLLALLSVVFFKLGLFPLHSWIPDVYQGSYLIVALFIGTVPKFSYIFLLLKIFWLYPSNLLVSYCLLIALLSVIYGTIISLYQTSLRRLLGYGSMAHMGLIVYSLILNTAISISSAVFYLLIYVILIISVFSFMFFLFEKNNNGFFVVDDISKLGSILNRNYLLSLYFSFILLSLAGLPFFVGFISKWYIFISLINKGYYIDLVFLLLLSVIGATYYIRLIRFIFFVSIKENLALSRTNIKFGKSFYILFIFLFILNLLVIYYHNWIYLYILKCILCYLSK